MCAAVDPALAAAGACLNADFAFPADAATAARWAEGVSMGPGVIVDSSSGLRTLVLSDAAGGENAVLDLTVEVRATYYTVVCSSIQ